MLEVKNTGSCNGFSELNKYSEKLITKHKINKSSYLHYLRKDNAGGLKGKHRPPDHFIPLKFSHKAAANQILSKVPYKPKYQI